jgi:site-specific DNA recombinase
MNQNKALIYCRVSSAKQVAEGDGLRSQEFRCQQFADRHDLIVEKVFHEKGVSGRGDFNARPAMMELLQYLDDHPMDKYCVIFDDLKRFARDTIFHFTLKKEFERRGAILLCPNFHFEDTPENTLMETMYAALGQWESQRNRKQVIQRMKARLERGYWVFQNVPPGYTYETDPVHNRLLVQVHPEARIIKEALEGFASGRFPTQRDLLHFFQKHPIQTKKKTLVVDYKMVHRILNNILYAGYIEFAAWGIPRTKGMHKPLISLKTYERIQLRQQQKPVSGIPKPDTDFQLTQMVLCDHCKHPFTSSTVKGYSRYYSYYACYNPSCKAPQKNYPKDQVEAAYIDALREIEPPEGNMEEIVLILRTRFQVRAALFLDCKKRVRDKIKDKEAEIASLIQCARQTPSQIVRGHYEKSAEEATIELAKLKAKGDGKRQPNEEDLLAFAEHFIRTVHEHWEKADRATKIAIHRAVFPASPCYSPVTGFRTAQKSLTFSLNKPILDDKMNLVDIRPILSIGIWEEIQNWESLFELIKAGPRSGF